MTSITSTMAVLPVDNVDTDQIIPARFLKVTERSGLGRHLFADWRYGADGEPVPDFVLNRPESAGAEVLLAGHNFGCGSSREHAAWALVDHGFRAVISTEFADIFRNNALKNGLLPVEVDAATHARLSELAGLWRDAEVTIDLVSRTLSAPGVRVEFPIDPFARRCLLEGVDTLGYLLAQEEAIAAFEMRREAVAR
jgi:3-isopropylmalate/(R)-2-methylmalate dehydratase small subunit